MTHFSYSEGLNSKYLYFYGKNKMLKMEYKENLSVKLLFLQNDQNILTNFLHSTDDMIIIVKALRLYLRVLSHHHQTLILKSLIMIQLCQSV